MIDSNIRGGWSIPEAQKAIRQAFLLRASEDGNLLPLRFVDIQRTISEEVKPINVTTFNRARRGLVDSGELTVEPKSKERWYTWTPKTDRHLIVSIALESDLVRIKHSSVVGTTARLDEAWSCYGVPISLKGRIHPKLRRECGKFQEGIDAIIEEEQDAFIDAVFKKAKKRLSTSEAGQAKKALEEVLAEASDRSEETVEDEFRAAFLEKIAPGTTELDLRKIMPPSLSDEKKRTRFLMKAYDLSEDEAKTAIDRANKTYIALEKLLASLHGRDRRWFVERFVALQLLGMNLVAVVR